MINQINTILNDKRTAKVKVIETKEINSSNQTAKLGESLKGDLWVQVSFGFRNSNK